VEYTGCNRYGICEYTLSVAAPTLQLDFSENMLMKKLHCYINMCQCLLKIVLFISFTLLYEFIV